MVLTSKEKQKRYRDKKKAESNEIVTENVTEVTPIVGVDVTDELTTICAGHKEGDVIVIDSFKQYPNKLPDCVPEPVVNRYKRGEPAYIKTIDRLLDSSMSELAAAGVWVPVWRLHAGEQALTVAV